MCVCVSGGGGYEERLLGRTERKRRNATVSKLEREGKKNDEVAGRENTVNEAPSPGRGRRNIGTRCEEQISWH